jgi:hypothetical protein
MGLVFWSRAPSGARGSLIFTRTGWVAITAALALARPVSAAEELRFEVSVLPDFQRHATLLAHPGYAAIALENIGLSPSLSSTLVVRERGKSVEIRYGGLRFVGEKGGIYSYDGFVTAGLGNRGPRVAFPVTVDATSLAAGKLVITMKPPLASLIPADVTYRIDVKLRTIANPGAQKALLDYVDQVAKAGPEGAPLFEAILLDSYNRSGGALGAASSDIGDALPLSDQWMLLLTLLIWAVAIPAVFIYRLRRRRAGPA